MPRLTARLLTALTLAAPVAGCGAGEDTPKRTVDPLDESLRFFPRDAEAVALLEPEQEAFATLSRAAGEISSAPGPTPAVTDPLSALGAGDPAGLGLELEVDTRLAMG